LPHSMIARILKDVHLTAYHPPPLLPVSLAPRGMSIFGSTSLIAKEYTTT